MNSSTLISTTVIVPRTIPAVLCKMPKDVLTSRIKEDCAIIVKVSSVNDFFKAFRVAFALNCFPFSIQTYPCSLTVFVGGHSAISFGLRKNGSDAVFLLSFAQLRRFRAFCHLPCRYLCRGCEKKVAFFMKKTSEKFCQFAELSYLCTRFRKKIRGQGSGRASSGSA